MIIQLNKIPPHEYFKFRDGWFLKTTVTLDNNLIAVYDLEKMGLEYFHPDAEIQWAVNILSPFENIQPGEVFCYDYGVYRRGKPHPKKIDKDELIINAYHLYNPEEDTYFYDDELVIKANEYTT
jgi:hypothetical protein